MEHPVSLVSACRDPNPFPHLHQVVSNTGVPFYVFPRKAQDCVLRNVTQQVTIKTMIRKISHKGLETFFLTGSKAGIRPEHAKRLKQILGLLNAAATVKDLNFPGSNLHKLRGDREGFLSIVVSGNWRVIFRFEAGDALGVDYLDYH